MIGALLLSAASWQDVTLALIAAAPGIIAAVRVGHVLHQIRTPSGDHIGTVMERTHELSAADVALTQQVHTIVTDVAVNGLPNGVPHPEGG